jgi:putative ABC transport system permease protein
MKSRLRPADLLPLGTVGLRTRPMRAALSALGIAIGIAAIVSVLGVTASSQAALLSQIDQLGTNLLIVVDGHSLAGGEVPLPATAPATIARVTDVTQVAATAELTAVHAYRSDLVPATRTGSLSVRAATSTILSTLDGALVSGRFFDAAAAQYPTAVLGSEAAARLGFEPTTNSSTRVWLTGHWFTIIGILAPLPLAPEIDRSVLIGPDEAATDYGYDKHPTRIYVRTATDQVQAVSGALARAANPAQPSSVQVSRPSDTLTARLAIARSGTSLFLGLGAVALLVAAIGIANVMVIGVLERRAEIGLRRAIGARRRHIAAQFLTESLLLSTLGGLAGVGLGTAITAALATNRGWTPTIPTTATWGGLAAAMTIGAIAGLYPAARAARLTPTDALRTT